MNLHFMNPFSSKLFSLLLRAYPSEVKGNTLEILNDINKPCQICQTYSSAPLSFSVRFPDETVFYKRITNHLIYLESDPVLHIVDKGTHFSPAKFIFSASSANIWETFVSIGINIYTEYPYLVHIDQGSAFNSIKWIQLYRNATIKKSASGIEFYN